MYPDRGPVVAKRREAGFTLLELMVVLTIIGIVLAIAGGTLVSLQQATNQDSALISDEQDASVALAQMAHDIRSADSISFMPSPTAPTAVAGDSVVFNENTDCAAATTTSTSTTNPFNPFTCPTNPVQWIYLPGGSSSGGVTCAASSRGCLYRETLSVSGGAYSIKTVRTLLTDVDNGPAVSGGTPVFKYYNVSGACLPTSSNITSIPFCTTSASGASILDATLETCTTAIGATLITSPAPLRGVTDFQEMNKVAITDQEQLLSAPNNNQC